MNKEQVRKEALGNGLVGVLEYEIRLYKTSNSKTIDKLKGFQIKLIDCYDSIEEWLIKYPKG